MSIDPGVSPARHGEVDVKFATLGLLPMAVAGCAGQVPSALPTAAILQSSPEPATQTPASETAGAEGSRHPYRPVIDGASWSYQGSGSGGDYFRTDTIDDVEPEAFVVETQLTDMHYFVTWNFTPEALVNLCAYGEFGTEIQLAFSNLPGAPTEGP